MIKFMLVFLFFFEMNAIAKPGPATIRGNFPTLNDGDQVNLCLEKYGTELLPGTVETYSAKVKNHSFILKLKAEDFPEKFDLFFVRASGFGSSSEFFLKYRNLGVLNFLITSGDRIFIQEQNGKKIFSGSGSLKNQILQKIKELDKYPSYRVKSPDDCLNYLFWEDSISMLKINYLNANKSALNEDVYTLLKANLIGQYFTRGGFLTRKPDSLQTSFRHVLEGYKWDRYPALFDSDSFKRHFPVHLSDSYAKGIIEKFRFDSCYMLNKKFSVPECYTFLKNNFTGALRERLVVNLLYENLYENMEQRPCINDALTYVHTPAFLKILQGLQLNVAGSKACKFSLPDEAGKIHSYSEFEGKIVVMDFWFTGCGACIQASSCLKEIQNLYRNKPVVFLSINFDRDKKDWIKSIASGIYTSVGRINLFTEGLAKDHPMTRFYNVTGAPRLFIIDKKGRIAENPENTQIDHGKSIISSIDKMLNEI